MQISEKGNLEKRKKTVKALQKLEKGFYQGLGQELWFKQLIEYAHKQKKNGKRLRDLKARKLHLHVQSRLGEVNKIQKELPREVRKIRNRLLLQKRALHKIIIRLRASQKKNKKK